MTKETKIGLLVGLAFIILFAIILSEKSGGGRDATLPTFALADANRKLGATTGSEKPLHDAGRLPVEAKLAPIVETLPSILRPAESLAATGHASAPLNTESLDELLNPPSELAQGVALDEGQGLKESQTVPLGEAVRTALEIGPPPVLPKPDAAAVAAEGRPDSILASAGPAGPRSSEMLAAGQPAKVEASPPIKTTHEVQPGESLGKIAAKYYGRSTPERVAAIFDANRDVLPNVNSVKATSKLRIPDLGEHSSQFEAVPTFLGTSIDPTSLAKNNKDDALRIPPPAAGGRTQSNPQQPAAALAKKTDRPTDEKAAAEKAAKKDQAASNPQFEWYEIKPSDTLTKIAARKLGDQKLYPEIVRLNRDRINNKNVLKPGVKIRLPVKVALSGPKGESLSSSGPETAEP